ncbi:MAG TPA: hypothetical protein VMR41_04335 [Patescibacteria group bacterium]|nr:hypothetical protein [Patescibacteria group bacterium]
MNTVDAGATPEEVAVESENKVESARQEQEVRTVGASLLQQRMEALPEGESTDAGVIRLKSIKELTDWVTEAAKQNQTLSLKNQDNPDGASFRGENINVTFVVNDGTKDAPVSGVLRNIIACSSTHYFCEIEVESSLQTVNIPKETINNLLFLNKADDIIKLFSNQTEKDLLNLYQQVAKGNSLDGADQTNQIIQKAADSAGLLNRNHIDLFVLQSRAHGTTFSPEDVQRIHETMKGKNILDPATIKVLVETQLSQLNQQLENLDPATPKAQTLNQLITSLQTISQGENNPLQQYFDKVDLGEIKPETSRKLLEAFSQGNMNNIVAVIKESIEKMSEGQKKQVEQFLNYAISGNSLSGMLLSLMLSLGVAVGQAAVASPN